jgi:HAD superfamily hydrolase (TIGR01509 family)
MIKAVLYDLDGVLIDTKDWHYLSLNFALKSFGYHLSEEEHKRLYEGLPTSEKLKMLTKSKGLPVGLYRRITELKNSHLAGLSKDNIKIDPVKVELVSGIKKQGLKQIVCTNTTKSTVMMMLSSVGLYDYLDAVFTRKDINKPKPNPEIYKKAIGYSGYKPEECLIFEDSEHGLKAATLSGAHVFCVQSVADLDLQLVMSIIERFS